MKYPVSNTPEQVSAVCYYRVSRNIQSDFRQENDVRDYCNNNGITIAETFREKISGTKRMAERPELAQCIDYVKSKEINLLVCSELSRLGRTPEVIHIIDELTQKKICVISLKENIRTLDDSLNPNADQLLMVNIINGLAIKEAETLSYRIKSGKRSAVFNKSGWTGGKFLPYGYKSKKGILTVEPKESGMVRRIFRKYNSGWGFIKIANWLNSKNIPTKLGKIWAHSTVRKLVQHQLYTGIRTYKEVKYSVPHMKIISVSTFRKANKRLEQDRIKAVKFRRKYDILLDHRLIKCGTCGKAYNGIVTKNLYICSSAKYIAGCGNRSIRMNTTEQAIQIHLLDNYSHLVRNILTSESECLQKNNLKFLIKGELSLSFKTGKIEYVNAFINKKILHQLISRITVNNEDGGREIRVQLVDGNSFVLNI